MNIDIGQALQFNISTFVGRCTALLGITGSGKTNTAAVLIEELLAGGLPLTIVDIEGEYWGLKERFEILVAGKSEHSELLLNPENAGALAQTSIERGISVILDLSEYTEEESYTCLVEYFTALWDTASKVKRPYQIVLEEAHEWLPEGVRTPLKTILTRIALRGRKRGLGIMLMSQRSAKVAKDVLTQASLLFLHKVVHPTDMKVYKDLIPLPPVEVEKMVGGLQPGHVVAINNHTPQIAQIRLRHTFHAGSTPTLEEDAPPELRKIDEKLLHDLQQLIAKSSPVAKDDKRLEKRIKELEELLLKKDDEIARRDEQIKLLSQLSVQMSGSAPVAPQLLEIDQATVNHMHVPGMVTTQLSPRIVEAVSPTKVIEQPLPVNEAKVKSLQRRISQMSQRQSQVFHVLVERGVALSVDEIAAWLNVDRSTVNKNLPPEALFKLGLISRSKRGNGYQYKSTLREHLAREFPGSGIDTLMQKVLQS